MIPLDGQIFVDGQFVSAKIERIVLAIKDYDPYIEVQWIPPESRLEEKSPAFRITLEEPGREPFILFFVNSEEDFDERVLQRIIVNDQRKFPLRLSDLEAWEETSRRIEHQRWLDELEAINDIAYHALKSPLNTYKVTPDLVIKEGIPHNAAHLDSHNRKKKGSPIFKVTDLD